MPPQPHADVLALFREISARLSDNQSVVLLVIDDDDISVGVTNGPRQSRLECLSIARTALTNIITGTIEPYVDIDEPRPRKQ